MKIGIALAATAAAVAALAATAVAGPPQPANGTGVFSLAVTSVQQAGPNTIFEGVATATYTGTITGLLTAPFRLILHADGQLQFHATGAIVGSVDGCGAGTIPIRLDSRGTFGAFTGRLVTINQAANTGNVRFNVTLVGSTPTFAYSGTYSCD